MTIGSHLTSFGGLPVRDVPPDGSLPKDPSGIAWRLRVDYDEQIDPLIDAFFAQEQVSRVEGIVFGHWSEMYDRDCRFVYERLVRASHKLKALRVIFVPDVTYEESEISWINQANVTPVLAVFPRLRNLGLRGGNELSFGPLSHAALEELVIQSGGLGGSLLRGVGKSTLPSLRRLELWLGTEDYGASTNSADLSDLLTGHGLPALEHLGLKDAHEADRVASLLGKSPLAHRVKVLDLSMGALGDEGARALIGAKLHQLEKLVIVHHYVSEAVEAEVVAAYPDTEVVFGERKEEEDEGWRYIEVSE